ncbi:MAG: molecular chaperone DnaK (HSP70), partial [Paracoccaceae bacterium]
MTESTSGYQSSSRISHSSSDSTKSQSKLLVTPQRPMGIGIDFGTTNSAAALFDGEKVHLVKLEHHSIVMPSAT